MERLKFDIHTHTVYSHGKGTIEDNYETAKALGLEVLGISDHGPGHLGFGLSMKALPEMKEKAARLTALGGPKVLIGVEANIINMDGELDVPADRTGDFDYILAGYHLGVAGKNPFRSAAIHAGALAYKYTGKYSQNAIKRNTEMVVQALKNNKIKVLTHPGDKAAFDIDIIAKACQDSGTWMEISNHHKCLTVEGIKTAAKYDVRFIIGSDAHLPGKVGEFQIALERARAAGLDLSRIVNLVTE